MSLTTKRLCDLACCIEPVQFISVYIDKKTHEVHTSYFCRFDYPEAWDLEGLGMKVTVYRLRDFAKIKECERIHDPRHRYDMDRPDD